MTHGSVAMCGTSTFKRLSSSTHCASWTAARIDGAFICTFIEPIAPYNEDPRYDLDMSALALVKTYERRQGTTFPDMAWDPIEAFFAVANCYAIQVTNEA